MADSTATREPVARTVPAGPLRWNASWRYYTCLVVLVVSAGTIQVTASKLGAYFRKAPADLRKPLYDIDKSQLRPDYDVHPIQPQLLDEDTITNLGTRDYIQLNLVDRTLDRSDPCNRPRLFVTYYTGQPDMVPHRPEECMVASGWINRGGETISIDVDLGAGRNVRIPVNVLEFVPPGGMVGASHGFYVMYFFVTNDRPIATREGVRATTKNLWERYAYYSKLEFSFSDDSGSRLPTREEAIEAGQRLLNKLMPVLWNEHYPDWAALEARGRNEK